MLGESAEVISTVHISFEYSHSVPESLLSNAMSSTDCLSLFLSGKRERCVHVTVFLAQAEMGRRGTAVPIHLHKCNADLRGEALSHRNPPRLEYFGVRHERASLKFNLTATPGLWITEE